MPDKPHCRSSTCRAPAAQIVTGIMPVTRGRLALPKCPEDCPADIFELIKDCTAHDPDDRPTAKECFERMKVRRTPLPGRQDNQTISRPHAAFACWKRWPKNRFRPSSLSLFVCCLKLSDVTHSASASPCVLRSAAFVASLRASSCVTHHEPAHLEEPAG